MTPPLKKFTAGPLSADSLNHELAKLVLEIVGDGLVEAKRQSDGRVTVSLNLGNLIPRIPKTGPQLIVRPKSNASGSGWYAGKIMIPATTASDPTTAFTATQIGSEGADCFIANNWEQGRSGHALVFTAKLPLEFPVIAVLPAKSDGTPCFLISGRQSKACA